MPVEDSVAFVPVRSQAVLSRLILDRAQVWPFASVKAVAVNHKPRCSGSATSSALSARLEGASHFKADRRRRAAVEWPSPRTDEVDRSGRPVVLLSGSRAR